MVKHTLDLGAISELCGVEKEPPQVVIRNIAEITGDCSEEDKAKVLECVLTDSKNPEVLLYAIKMSESYRNGEILSKLLDILLLKNIDTEDIDSLISVRVLCAKTIACYKDTSSIGALLYCLNNKNENYKIRLACADALGRIGDKFAVKSLIDVVKDENEKSVYVQESATFALGLLGDTSAVDPLVSIMEAKQGLLGKFSFLKERIVEALGKLNINSTKVLKVYKNALMDSSPMVRINAIEALMNSGSEEAASLIRTALNDEDNEVQRNALIALYNVHGRDILEEVISLPGYSGFLKDEAQELMSEYEEE